MKLRAQDVESISFSELYGAEDLTELYDITDKMLARHFEATGYAILLKDRRKREFLEHACGIGAEAARSGDLYSAPLKIRGTDFGVLRLDFEDGRKSPAADCDERQLTEFCDHLSFAIYFQKVIDDQSQIIDATLNHVQALKSMAELLGELDIEKLLNRLLKFFIDALDLEVGAAHLHSENLCQAEARWGLPPEVLERIAAAADAGELEPNSGTLQRVLLPYVEVDESRRFTLGFTLRISFSLKAPHSAEFYIVSGQERELSAAESELLESCRIVGSIAMQKSLDYEESVRQHRLNEQLIVARDIQRDFMPTELPSPVGLQVAGKSLPALYVGGDYYDVVEQPGGGHIAIIADVSGKGIQAAMRMSAVRAVFYTLAHQNLGPGETLARLNWSILETSRKMGLFVTACCLGMDREGSVVRLALAGHEPILKYSLEEGAEFMELEGGLPLGLRPNQDYEEFSIDLRDGESLFFYTDGIPDASNDGRERYGVERMVESFARNAQKPAAELLDSMFKELESFKGEASWSDDLTALTINRSDGGLS
jgi:sigma-B regulation protein RsbU (phosphoserine phosphatase)